MRFTSNYKFPNIIKNHQYYTPRIDTTLSSEPLFKPLNDSLHYDYAYDNTKHYYLKIDEQFARNKVSKYRSELKTLDNVNLIFVDSSYKLKKIEYEDIVLESCR